MEHVANRLLAKPNSDTEVYMNNFKRAMPLLMLCALPFIAVNSVAAENNSSIYVGGGIGYGRMNGEDFSNSNGDLSKSKTSWKAIIGAKLNDALAMEAQYLDFGAANRNSDRIQATGWTAGITLDLLKNASITPYAKVGALFWETDNRFNGISRSQDGTDLTGGLGLRFAVADRLSIRTEYERFMMDNTDIDSLSVNLQYNFF